MEMKRQLVLYGGPTTVEKIGDKGWYRFDLIKVHLSIKEGRLVARVGGGYSTFEAFLKTFKPILPTKKTSPKAVKQLEIEIEIEEVPDSPV
jgi:hypothetical protein